LLKKKYCVGLWGSCSIIEKNQSEAIINCLENLRPLSGVENCGKNTKYNKLEFLE
jgi:hypothetical protein